MEMSYRISESVREYIEANSAPIPETGCWIWEASEFQGNVDFEGQSEPVDNLAFEAFKGPIPNGKFVAHRCHVGICVNPEHLRLSSIPLAETG